LERPGNQESGDGSVSINLKETLCRDLVLLEQRQFDRHAAILDDPSAGTPRRTRPCSIQVADSLSGPPTLLRYPAKPVEKVPSEGITGTVSAPHRWSRKSYLNLSMSCVYGGTISTHEPN